MIPWKATEQSEAVVADALGMASGLFWYAVFYWLLLYLLEILDPVGSVALHLTHGLLLLHCVVHLSLLSRLMSCRDSNAIPYQRMSQ